MCFASKVFGSELGPIHRRHRHAWQRAANLLGQRPHREALEAEQDFGAGLLLHLFEDRQIAVERAGVDDEGRRLDVGNVEREIVHHTSITCQGRPAGPRRSRKGFDSNSSRLNTPGFFHLPVSIISAPTAAPTPVVYDTACAPTSL